ncbi:hypothetical protein WJX77_008517 [Trebouxia sp. C0004]
MYSCLLSTPGYIFISQHSPAVPLDAQVLVGEQALTSATYVMLSVIGIRCTLLMLPANAKRSSQRRLGVLADMLTFTRREKDHAEGRLATAQILITGLEKSVTRAQHDREGVTVQEREASQQGVQQLKSENADLSRKLADAVAGQAAAHTQVQQLQGSNADLAAQLADAASGKAAAEQHIQQLQERSDHLSAELADVVSSTAAAEQQLHCVIAHNKKMTVQLADAMSDKASRC